VDPTGQRPAPTSAAESSGADGEDSAMTRAYAAVLIVQVVVLLALWAAGRYFATP
jgi:hypothetical protein